MNKAYFIVVDRLQLMAMVVMLLRRAIVMVLVAIVLVMCDVNDGYICLLVYCIRRYSSFSS